MNVLVTYESRGGRTKNIAQSISEDAARKGHTATVKSMAATSPDEIAQADCIVVGTWVEGFILFGVHPAHAATSWVSALPSLEGKSASVFCTYAVNPRSSLDELKKGLESRGAKIGASQAFHGSRKKEGIGAFVDAALSAAM
ncbi:MAG: flavodoxin family protein [Acidimicrobiales bacterium]